MTFDTSLFFLNLSSKYNSTKGKTMLAQIPTINRSSKTCCNKLSGLEGSITVGIKDKNDITANTSTEKLHSPEDLRYFSFSSSVFIYQTVYKHNYTIHKTNTFVYLAILKRYLALSITNTAPANSINVETILTESLCSLKYVPPTMTVKKIVSCSSAVTPITLPRS